MGSAVIINAYFLAPQGDQGGSTYNNPTGFTVSGSNNASSWTTIQTFSNITGFAAGSYKTFEFTNTTAYRYYRLAASNTGVSLSEWKVRTADGTTGEGGMVWIKARNTNLMGHIVTDTERGVDQSLIKPNVTIAQDTNHQYGYLSSFNSNGFAITSGSSNADRVNNSSYEYASWTWRKAPKWFDVVTYTGNGNC